MRNTTSKGSMSKTSGQNLVVRKHTIRDLTAAPARIAMEVKGGSKSYNSQYCNTGAMTVSCE